MATVTTRSPPLPPPPGPDELEALIEEARRRQRRRRRVGAAVLLVAVACGVGVYVLVAHGGGSPAGMRSSRRAVVAAPTRHAIVFAADRVAVRHGEIYLVGPNGRRVDLSRSPARDILPAVSPNGSWVAFLSDRDGRGALYAVRTGGGSPVRLSPDFVPSAGMEGQIEWAPDGGRIAVAAQSGSTGASVLYLTGLDGRGAVVSRDFVDQPAWSADGRLLAYRANRELVVAARSGLPRWHLRVNPRSLAWSKTGRLAVDDGHRTSVYDESGRLLGSTRGSSYWSPWSPSGARLASRVEGLLEVRLGGVGRPVFSARVPYPSSISWLSEHEVEVSSDDGRTDIDVTTGRRRFSSSPVAATSPDGSRIALVASSGDVSTLKLARADGNGAHRIARASCSSDIGSPFGAVLFTPDGRGIVYQTSCAEPPANVYAISPDGTHLRRLTQTTAHETGPSLSPNGREIAFSEAEAPGLACKGCTAVIRTMRVDGTHARQLTQADSSAGTYDQQPSWSPDGRWIVFSRTSFFSAGLFVVAASGGATRPLHVWGTSPAWGPRTIAYVADDGIRTVKPDGSDQHLLVRGRGIVALAWSKDGRLAYLASRGAAVAVRANGGPTTSFRLPLRATAVAWSPDGTRVLVAASTHGLPSELYTVGVRGGHLRPLTTDIGSIAGMSWR